MAPSDVRFFVFDIETVADGELVSKLRFPDDGLSPEEAIQRYREELIEKNNSDFIPYTYQLPVAVVIAKVADDFRLLDLVVLDEPQFRPHVITEHFWRGWDRYGRPTFVSFNGRGFDLPVMELCAFRFAASAPSWFDSSGPSYQQPRNRYNTASHLDLHDLLTNFGATRFHGGLNLAANLIGKPGKINVHGQMVQDLYNEGKVADINDYCCCDVLDTYFVFLRCQVMLGNMTLDREQELVGQGKKWIEERADARSGFRMYMNSWGDWKNPWRENQE